MTMPDQVEVTPEEARTIMLYQAAHALKDFDVKQPGCGFAKLSKGLKDLADDLARAEADKEAAIQKARADALGDAYDKLRGTNADLCKTPGAAYRLMLDTLRSLTESEVSRAE